VTNDAAPVGFDGCCILADPFAPPTFNFTEKMNFKGKKVYDGKKIVEFGINAPSSGGDFVHAFYDNEETDFNGDTYYKPAYFYMSGTSLKELF
jgi:hypothetical protein